MDHQNFLVKLLFYNLFQAIAYTSEHLKDYQFNEINIILKISKLPLI